MFRALNTRDLNDHLCSELTGIEMAPSPFSRVITWAGAPATRTGKGLMLVSVHLDYDFPLAFVQLNACNKPWGGKPENLFVKAALIQGYPPLTGLVYPVDGEQK